MFRKMLSDGNIKHFKYAPPTTGLDDISDDRLPEPPYAGVPTEQRSVLLGIGLAIVGVMFLRVKPMTQSDVDRVRSLGK